MIKIVDGNILEAKEDIICQQVNCQGVMGSGLAKQIRNKYPEIFENYISVCNSHIDKKELLGQICSTLFLEDNKIVANLFGQLNYGYSKKQYTDYEALKKCFSKIYDRIKNDGKSLFYQKSIAIPYNMGCGLGGGDWNVVYKIIEDIFKDVDVTIYRF